MSIFTPQPKALGCSFCAVCPSVCMFIQLFSSISSSLLMKLYTVMYSVLQCADKLCFMIECPATGKGGLFGEEFQHDGLSRFVSFFLMPVQYGFYSLGKVIVTEFYPSLLIRVSKICKKVKD